MQTRVVLGTVVVCALLMPIVAGADATSEVGSETASAETEPRLPVALAAPAMDHPPDWAVLALDQTPRDLEGGEVRVQSRRHNAPVYSDRRRRGGRGLIRYGTVLSATRLGGNAACRGSWYDIGNGGYVCSTYGFQRSIDEVDLANQPDADSPLPFAYGQVVDREAYRFDELPTARVLERVAEGRRVPGAEELDGDYFITLESRVEGPDGEYWRTVDDHFVPVTAVEAVEASGLHGEYDPQGLTLPLAFVHEEDTRVRRRGAWEVVGRAQKYARYPVEETLDHEGHRYVVGPTGIALRRDEVRLAQLRAPHEDIGEGEKWIHVDLDQQVLVAYEGRLPVFATLIASGKEGYDTPTGIYRVGHSYLSITMSGDDPVDGVYDVAEVPWTMYYYRSYALHGAYWHDSFGNVRSHGCTNIAPNDARFLFHWSTPNVPEGWQGVREEGTWVWNTRASDDG